MTLSDLGWDPTYRYYCVQIRHACMVGLTHLRKTHVFTVDYATQHKVGGASSAPIWDTPIRTPMTLRPYLVNFIREIFLHDLPPIVGIQGLKNLGPLRMHLTSDRIRHRPWGTAEFKVNYPPYSHVVGTNWGKQSPSMHDNTVCLSLTCALST